MRTAISLASVTPLALNLICWLGCECGPECGAWSAAACMAAALAIGAAIFVTASIARALHQFSRHRPPLFRAEGFG